MTARSVQIGRPAECRSGCINHGSRPVIARPCVRRPASFSRLRQAGLNGALAGSIRGLSQRRPGKRAKSELLEHSTKPCSMASAARCASGTRLARASWLTRSLPSTSLCRSVGCGIHAIGLPSHASTWPTRALSARGARKSERWSPSAGTRSTSTRESLLAESRSGGHRATCVLSHAARTWPRARRREDWHREGSPKCFVLSDRERLRDVVQVADQAPAQEHRLSAAAGYARGPPCAICFSPRRNPSLTTSFRVASRAARTRSNRAATSGSRVRWFSCIMA